MTNELFEFPEGVTADTTDALVKKNLKPLPKLISTILANNIIPRLGDRVSMRHYDVKTLHALTTGRPALSLKQLILYNIWESRESNDKKMIPHIRLINKLLINAKVLSEDARCIKRSSVQLTKGKLNNCDFQLIERSRVWRLRDTKSGRWYDCRKEDADSGDDTEEEEHVPQEGGMRGMEFAMTPWYRVDQQLVVGRRPNGYPHWTPAERAIWDQAVTQEIRHNQWMVRESKLKYQFNVATTYGFEKFINNLHLYNEQVRMFHNFQAQLPVTQVAPPTNWEAASSEAAPQAKPYPQSFASSWLPIHPPPPPDEGSSSQGGVIDKKDVYVGYMESIFGEKQPYPRFDPNNDYGYQ
ncbi:uncharacterized protein LOC143545273 [Bidens hawaiensis]|uniref:uncharacterized protein LOC143545273 n=1 Tax=Bidens hawaiensis TaxID=980011 RepID=UPI00404A6770